jgi:cellulase/cellobiase CelA1
MEIVLCENRDWIRVFDNKCLMKNIYSVIGTGNSESKKTDYCLESPWSVSDATYNRLVVYSSENGYKVSMTINGTNRTNADVTIQEVGVFKTLYYANSSSTKDTLILRHVLQTPIVLRANEPFSINVEWIEQ